MNPTSSEKTKGTNEVQSLAEKVTKKIKYNKENVIERIVKFIMNIKVEDILKDIEDAKIMSTRDQKSLDEIVRPNTVVAGEFRSYIRNKLERNWRNRKDTAKKQVMHLKNKYNKKFVDKCPKEEPGMFMGVKVSDEMLGESDIPKKTKIHDDVVLTAEEEATVDVLPKDTFYSNITRKREKYRLNHVSPKWDGEK